MLVSEKIMSFEGTTFEMYKFLGKCVMELIEKQPKTTSVE
jgi:hypothetical protein